MSSEVRKRAPFELLAFTAAPVAGALVVIELEGRFAAAAQGGRFTRRPVLVVEPGDDRPRLELAPVRAELHDAYWRGVFAIPVEELAGARFALGLRGTLLELPPPDASDGAASLTALPRDAAHCESADRIATLEAELAEARRAAAEEAATLREETTTRVEAAEQRAIDAEARAQAAENTAQAAEAGTEVLRAELAEERERPRAMVAEARPAAPAPPEPAHHTTASRGPGPWIAVCALVLFAFVLLGLLAGFLA